MKRSALAKWYRCVTSVYLLAVLLLCVLNFGSFSEDVPPELLGFRIDHVVHSLMFFPMPILFFLVYAVSVSTPLSKRLVVIFILCIVLASCTELMQTYLIPWRSGEWSDLMADAAGITSGCLVCIICKYVRRHRSAVISR